MATGKDDTRKTDQSADKDPEHQRQEESRLLDKNQGLAIYSEGSSEEGRFPQVINNSYETCTSTCCDKFCGFWCHYCRYPCCNNCYCPCKTAPKEPHVLRYTTTSKGDKLYNVDSEIMKEVKERLLSVNIQLIKKPSQTENAHEPCIVFCVKASRLAADVQDAFPDLEVSPIILIIFHPIDKDRLLTEKMASGNSSLSEYIKKKCQDRIIHFAFQKDKGVYSCNENKQSYKELEEILRALATRFSAQ